MKYRSREQIMYRMLQELSTEKTRMQTHIMYDCRLSYAQLKEYVEYMEKAGFVKRVGSLLAIQPEGRDYLKSLEKVFSIELKPTS